MISFGSLYTMQKLSNLGKIALLLVCFKMVLTRILTQVHESSLTLGYIGYFNEFGVGGRAC